MAHGYHHEFPRDPYRLVAPPFMSWPLALVIGTGYALGFGALWTPLFAGTVAGYLAYDWIHYYAHHARPKTRIGRFMQRYHLQHHYRDHDAHFGISCPLWDLVFGTYKVRVRGGGG